MISAAAILTLLATNFPGQFAEEPRRFAVIAVAAQHAVSKVAPKWRRGEKVLLAALLTAATRESGFRQDIHSGELRGKAGEVCLVQIHPTNPAWKKVGAPTFDALGGVGLEATTYCLEAGALSLIQAANYCTARKYRRNWAQAMWTAYHYGGQCWLSPHAYGRTALMWRMYSRIGAASSDCKDLVDSIEG